MCIRDSIYMLGWGGQLSDTYFVYAYPIFNPLLPVLGGMIFTGPVSSISIAHFAMS